MQGNDMASKSKTPLHEMTNPGGIGHAITSRLAKMGAAREALATGSTDSGIRVTPNRAARLKLQIRTLESELEILYARRKALNETALSRDLDRMKAASKLTADGAPSARVEDWE